MFSTLVRPENIVLDLQSTDKDELFPELVEFLVRKDPSIDRDEALKALSNREEIKNTCTNPGIAVPHAHLTSIKNTQIILGISRAGIDYELEGVNSSKSENLVHLVLTTTQASFPITLRTRATRKNSTSTSLIRYPAMPSIRKAASPVSPRVLRAERPDLCA